MDQPDTPKEQPTHRQRVVDASAGGGLGALLVWMLDLFGVPITPAAAAVLATMVATAAVALGRSGIRGLAVRLWRGANGD